ncbi:MAG: hypothetical protein ACTSXD_08390 [Candidatus Heimdallarchaeaceae archaeon]
MKYELEKEDIMELIIQLQMYYDMCYHFADQINGNPANSLTKNRTLYAKLCLLLKPNAKTLPFDKIMR